MINPFKEINWQPSKAEKRKFGLSLMIGFPCIALIIFLGRGLAGGNWNPFLPGVIAAVGFGVGLVSWLLPAIALPFYTVWFFLAASLGIVIGNTILALFYFLIVTPIGLALRMAGRPTISKGPRAGVQTYWQDAEQPGDVQRYYRQF